MTTGSLQVKRLFIRRFLEEMCKLGASYCSMSTSSISAAANTNTFPPYRSDAALRLAAKVRKACEELGLITVENEGGTLWIRSNPSKLSADISRDTINGYVCDIEKALKKLVKPKQVSKAPGSEHISHIVRHLSIDAEQLRQLSESLVRSGLNGVADKLNAPMNGVWRAIEGLQKYLNKTRTK